jgi:demethylmenaquinone methyltransferase/2-methoxy-6-polyprenyl-1,4-benzoquinol methylase
VVKKLASCLTPDAQVLDVGCGTGDLSIEIFEKTAAPVVGIDFCRPMLDLARQKAPHLRFIEGDALRLPFGDGLFDCVLIAFALRNLSSTKDGLTELRRVLKPNGKLAILEFSQPTFPGLRQMVRLYYGRLLPWIGGRLSGSRSAYEYLPDSISKFPNQEALAELMRAAGFVEVTFENLSGGVAALHTGRRA